MIKDDRAPLEYKQSNELNAITLSRIDFASIAMYNQALEMSG